MARSNYRRDRRNILGKLEAEDILEPHVGDLRLALHDGLKHFLNEPAAQMVPYRKRTRANMLNDAIVTAAIQRLDGAKKVVIDTEFEGTFLLFNQVLALRYKKLENDSTCNIRTDRQREVDGQVLEFEGIRRPTIVTLGYTLNAIWTEITEAKIFCQFYGRREWAISLFVDKQSSIFPISKDQFDEGPKVRSKRKPSSGEETA